MKNFWRLCLVIVSMCLLVTAGLAQSNLLPNGDFETMEPNFFTKMNDGLGGASAVWATDEAAAQRWGANPPSFYSFKVDKPAATTDAVGWVSDNNADLYWNNAGGGDLYNLTFFAKTMNVNTAPANQDEKIGVWFKYYAANVLLGEQFVEVDQTVATKDWTEYTGGLVVSSEPDSVVAVLTAEKNATGTVWFDNIDCNTNSGWTMGMFNGDAETPEGWMYWSSSDKLNYCSLIEDANANSGTHSVLLYENDNADDEMVYYSEPIPADPDSWYKLSVWVKTDSVDTNDTWVSSNVTPDRLNDRIGVTFFFHRTPLQGAWDLTGGDQFFYVDQRNPQTGWTHYVAVAKSPSDAAGVSIRARFTSFPTGYAWYDDFSIEKLEVQPNILTNGDLETIEPNYFSKLNDGLGGASAIWATDEAAAQRWGANPPSFYSFKVDKPATTTDAVGWVSDNNADLYWNNAGGGDLYNLTFFAKTMNVNTSPATQDEKIGVWFKYYATGTLLGEQFVEVDQTVATKDWTEYTGGLVISSEPDSVIVIPVAEKNATGTVWFDNIDCNTNSGWTMGVFNGDAETPENWMYWSSSDKLNFCALIEDANANSGTHSALLYENDTADDEMVFYSEPEPAKASTWYMFSMYVKSDSVDTNDTWVASNVTPDRLNDRIGATFFFHRTPLRGAWDLTGGDQFFYIDQRNPQTGWTQYIVIAESPVDAAGVSIRARYTSFPTGYSWYDDFAIQEVNMVTSIDFPDPKTETTIASDYKLANNYPNPFNPYTMIEFKVPQTGQVALNIYNMLGQKVRTLVNETRVAGTYNVIWDGRDDSGQLVTSGTYVYQLKGENALITKKMTFLK